MLRDRKYLDSIHDERCLICGQTPCDPAHIGTAGKSIKSPDNESLPLCNRCHSAAHREGEISYLRGHLPTAVLREALRAYGRELYQTWREQLMEGK